MFGLGIALSRENEKIIHALRSPALSLCVFLLPLFAAIVVLFLGTLPFTGMALLWKTGFGVSLLLTLVTLGILFVNGVFQDGTEGPPYRGPLRLLIAASILGLPAMGCLASYAVWLRYEQYGLTPDRFFAFLYAGVATLYGIGYAVAALVGRSGWLGGIRAVNITFSFVLVFLCLAPHTPLLDPMRLSANQQFGRITRGEVDAKDFDFGLFQFDLGSIGRARIAALKSLETHPKHADILKEIKQVVEAKYRWDWERIRNKNIQKVLDPDDLLLHPPGIKIPEDVLRAATKRMSVSELLVCREDQQCAVLALQLDSDPDLEYVVIPGRYGQSFLIEITAEGRWRSLPLLRYEYGNWAALAETIRDGDVGALSSSYRRVRIGDKVWVVMDKIPSASSNPSRDKPE